MLKDEPNLELIALKTVLESIPEIAFQVHLEMPSRTT